jgi:hypothetical protein
MGITRGVLEGTIGEVLMQIQRVLKLVLIRNDLVDAALQREAALNSKTVTL